MINSCAFNQECPLESDLMCPYLKAKNEQIANIQRREAAFFGCSQALLWYAKPGNSDNGERARTALEEFNKE